MKTKSNGIAKILSSKQVPIFQLTQDEATTIAHEHANLLDQRVKSDAESFLEGDLKTWLKQAQDLRKYIKENPTSQVAEAGRQATMPIVSASSSALSHAPDITLPGFCLELRRLRPPNAFDYGSSDGNESVTHAQPSEPVAGVPYIASSQQTFPADGILSLGAAAGHVNISGRPVLFRTTQLGDFDVSFAKASLFKFLPTPEQRQVTVSLDVTIEVTFSNVDVRPPVNLVVVNNPLSTQLGLAVVQGRIGITLYAYDQASQSLIIQNAPDKTFVSAGTTGDSASISIFQDTRHFSGNSAISGSLVTPRGSTFIVVAVDAFVYALSGLASDVQEERFAAIDYRRHDGFIGPSQYSLLVDQARLVKISVTELRAVVCALGRDGSV